VSARWAETSENVTSSALASLYGLSVMRTFSMPLPEGALGESPPQAAKNEMTLTRIKPIRTRMGPLLLSVVRQELHHIGVRTGRWLFPDNFNPVAESARHDR
jgi:hypothetical protein